MPKWRVNFHYSYFLDIIMLQIQLVWNATEPAKLAKIQLHAKLAIHQFLV